MKNSSLQLLNKFLKDNPSLEYLEKDIEKTVDLLKQTYYQGNKVILAGNGGSAADSLHVVGEFLKNFIIDRGIDEKTADKLKQIYPSEADLYINNLQRSIPSISLIGELAFTSAYMNDADPNLIFAQGLYAMGKKGDVLWGFSTSGNSTNLLHAFKVAKAMDISTISFTGNDGGKLKELSDINLNINEDQTYRIQEYHLPLYHIVCILIENELFGE